MDHTEVHSSITSPLIDSPAEKTGKKSLVIRIILNFFIYLTCYIVFFILKKKGFIYDINYIKFLPIMIAGWGLGSLLSKKFRIKPGAHSACKIKKILYFISGCAWYNSYIIIRNRTLNITYCCTWLSF